MVNVLRSVALAYLLLVLIVGCGPRGPKTYEVSGKVTLDGEPVADGEIQFRDPSRQSQSWAGKIVDGQYTMQSTEGNKRVEIIATREIQLGADAPSGEGTANFEMYIPKEYNSNSTLTAEVTSSGNNTFDFELNSKPHPVTP